MRKRIYVAGPYSADNVMTVLDNMRRGMRVCTELLLQGHAPFCPWLDYQFQLMLRGDESLSVSDYHEYSIAWLAVADEMLVLPGWKNSKGTLGEIELARKRGIPIAYNVSGAYLKEMRDGC